MSKFTLLLILTLVFFLAVCTASKNSIIRFQINDDANEIDADDHEPISDDILDDRKNAIIVEDEPPPAPVLASPPESSGIINHTKAPSSMFEYILEGFYGICVGIYHSIFGSK